MTEQPVNHSPALEEIRKNDLRLCHSDTENTGEERAQSRHGGADQPQAPDPDFDISGRRRSSLVRCKTLDSSLLAQIETNNIKIERKKYHQLSKPNSHYHKVFKEISVDEILRQSYPCALQKDMLYQGRMFVSENWICFHSRVFGRDTKIAIPVVSVTQIKKSNTAILVPNALVITTASVKHVFVSFLSRDTTYKVLMSVCPFLVEKSPCSSPLAVSKFKAEPPAQFSLGFGSDLSDLDATGRKSRPDMDESSSSDSPSPEYKKTADFPVLPPPFLGDVLKSGEAPPTPPDLHLRQSPEPQQATQYNGTSQWSEVVYDLRTMKPMSLNTLLFIYLFLVFVLILSSCYMALKIMSLEQRLTTLGSMTAFSHSESEHLRGPAEVNSEIYSELTLNLLKLEKVQRNLQRLLDEAE